MLFRQGYCRSRRALSQHRTGPHWGRLSQSTLVTQWCYTGKGNAGHRQGVITARDWSSRGEVITVQAGHPVVNTARLTPDTGRALSQHRTGPHGGRLSQSKLVTQWCVTGRALSQLRTGPHGGRLSQSRLVTQWCVAGRALSQLRTGPHGGRLSQSKLVTQWCYCGLC